MRGLLRLVVASACGCACACASSGVGAGDLDAEVDAPSAGFDAAGVDAPADARVPDAAPPDGAPVDAALPDAGPAVCGDLRLWFRFDESTGPVVDASGCGNHGTASGVTRGETGWIGSAYRFNSATTTAAHVLVPDSPSISDLGMLTVEAWVRHTGGMLETIVDHGNAMGGDPFIFHTFVARDPAMTLGFYPTCDGMGTAASGAPLALDAWTHMAVTVNNTTALVLFYIDGVQVASGTGYMNMGHMCDNTESMIVGGIDTVGGWGFEGWMDELRIWGVIRTQPEICADAGGTAVGTACSL